MHFCTHKKSDICNLFWAFVKLTSDCFDLAAEAGGGCRHC